MSESTFKKYLKLFSYILILGVCCNVIFSLWGAVKCSEAEAGAMYQKWEKEWEDITNDESIGEKSTYIKEKIYTNAVEENEREQCLQSESRLEREVEN